MTHRFFFSYRKVGLPTVLVSLMMILAACGGQPQPTINPNNAVSITRIDGSASLAHSNSSKQSELPDSALLIANDHLYTAANQTVTLQFQDGSTLQMGSSSHLLLLALRPADHVAVFRLLAGSVTGDVRGTIFEVQAYEEVAMNFSMVTTDLIVAPRGAAGLYQLSFGDKVLTATINAGEFDVRSGNQQATLPTGWQAIAEPNKPLQILSLITPTPAPPSATEAPTATPIPIITIMPTDTPTDTPAAPSTDTATPTPTRTPTRILRTIVAATNTAAPTTIADTPVPTATEKPNKPPKPTNPPPPQPTNPPPPPPPPPQPTNPPRPTPSGS